MNILALETSGEHCSAAVYCGGHLLVKTEADTTQRSRNILAMAASLLQEAGLSPAQLDGLVWNAGPGSFTGLRMGASICQAIAFVHHLPILSLSSLRVYAQAAVEISSVQDGIHIGVAVDARMGEIYWASFIYKDGSLHYLEEDVVLPADRELVSTRLGASGAWLLAGDGWGAASLDIGQHTWCDTSGYLARAMAGIALKASPPEWSNDPEVCLPRYLRGATQWKKRERLQKTVGIMDRK